MRCLASASSTAYASRCQPCFLILLYRSIMLDFQADAHAHVSHDLQDDRQQQLGKWRGTISEDRFRPSSPSPSYPSYAASRSSQTTSSHSAESSNYARAPPPPPLTRPLSRGSSPQSSSSPDPGDLSQNDHLQHYAACLPACLPACLIESVCECHDIEQNHYWKHTGTHFVLLCT